MAHLIKRGHRRIAHAAGPEGHSTTATRLEVYRRALVRARMDFDPHLVIEGIAICCYACRIQRAYFYIRGEYHHQARVFENALKEAYANGIFGPKGIFEMQGSPEKVKSRSAGRDPRSAERLWEVSEHETGVTYDWKGVAP